MAFENHGGPCRSGCERIACMCAHEKLTREWRERGDEITRLCGIITKLENEITVARDSIAVVLKALKCAYEEQN
jgi:hypothetical protein